jgi:hypothetical protein
LRRFALEKAGKERGRILVNIYLHKSVRRNGHSRRRSATKNNLDIVPQGSALGNPFNAA